MTRLLPSALADEEFLSCKCGFTCGTPKALEKHQLRGCSATSAPEAKNKLARSLTTSLTPTCARRWSQPKIQKESSESLRQRQRPDTWDLSSSLNVDFSQDLSLFARPKLQHAHSDIVSSQTLSRRGEGLSVDAGDSTLSCGCGFTCGTPSALDRHHKRCSTWSAPASPAAVDKAFDRPLRSSSGSDAGLRSSPPTPVSMDKAAARNAAARLQAFAEPMQPLRLLLVRHGESANRGSTSKCPDPALSPKGQRQAAALADRLAGDIHQVAAAGDVQIWCSPMLRCLETIKPTMDALDLPRSKCICHGACYEHGCAGLSFKGTPAEEIEDRFPNFRFMGFNSQSFWDYTGSNDKETSAECVQRARRIVEWLQPQLEEAMRGSSTNSPVVILVLHQTLGDLLLQLLLHGTSTSWTYGDPKYKLKNASVTELSVQADGQVTCKEHNSDYHVADIR